VASCTKTKPQPPTVIQIDQLNRLTGPIAPL